MTKEPISKVKEIFSNATLEEKSILVNKYQNDDRVGIQNEIQKVYRAIKQKEKLKNNFVQLSRYEKKFHENGIELIAGVDEAGRGCLAGPMVASAVILKPDCYIEGLKDCKQLLPKQREAMYEVIIENAVDYSIVEVSHSEIDITGLQKANLQALCRAVNILKIKPEFVFSDGFKIEVDCPSLKIIKGDTVSANIASASVLAKVYRDRLMDGYNAAFPDYNFSVNKGYGTTDHMEALEKYGPIAIHRKSFSPIRESLAEKLKL